MRAMVHAVADDLILRETENTCVGGSTFVINSLRDVNDGSIGFDDAGY